MKQKPTFKSVLLVASFFSLLAFLFVNFHYNSGASHSFSPASLVQTQMVEDNDDTNGRKVSAPDVTILERLLEISQKLISRKH